MNLTYAYSSDMLSHQTEFTELSSTLKFDRVVGIHNGQKLYLSEVLYLIFHDRIAIQATKGKKDATGRKLMQPGWIHLGKDKNDLQSQNQTTWVRSVSTILKYVQSGYEYMTYGTFNVSKKRAAWERRKSALNSVHSFVIDIDNPDVSVSEIVGFCAVKGLEPTFINATPNGFHVWFVFTPEGEAFGPHKTKDDFTNTGRFYNDLNSWLVDLFKEGFENQEDKQRKTVDYVFGGERYIRIPTNIVYCTKTKYSLSDFVELRKELGGNRQNTNIKRNGTYIPKVAIYNDPAYKKLLTKEPQIGLRRKTALTISLLYKELNYNLGECITALEYWYSTVCKDTSDFPWKEVERQARSAYSGTWGLSSTWVKRITGLYPRRYTRKKSPEERMNKTLKDACDKFIEKLKENDGVWVVSNRSALEELNETSKCNLDRTVKKLMEEGIISKEVSGRGRAAETKYTLLTDPSGPEKEENKNKNLIQFPADKMGNNGPEINAPKPYKQLSSFKGGVGGPPKNLKIRGKPG
ncbi:MULTISPECIES: hypothetical protein [Bacillota]|uniref:hypothetical protein n=1 Tax=Bacillota TaxID=1239 RepID=UPI0039EE4F2E